MRVLQFARRLGEGAPRECTGDADALALRGARIVAEGTVGGCKGALAAAALGGVDECMADGVMQV